MYSLVFFLVVAAASAQQYEQVYNKFGGVGYFHNYGYQWPYYNNFNSEAYSPYVYQSPYYPWNTGAAAGSHLYQWPYNYNQWYSKFVHPYYFGVYGDKFPQNFYNTPNFPYQEGYVPSNFYYPQGGFKTGSSFYPFFYPGLQGPVVEGTGLNTVHNDNYNTYISKNVNFPVTTGEHPLFQGPVGTPYGTYLNQKIPIVEVF